MIVRSDSFLMCSAGWRGDVEALRGLVARGVSVNAWDRGDGTALKELARSYGGNFACPSRKRSTIERDAEALDFLLEMGADPNIKDYWGDGPLDNAALRANRYLVGRLIDAGADVNAKRDRLTHKSDTPLHQACCLVKKDSGACAQLLIQAGARINERTTEGHTPLSMAVCKRTANPNPMIKVLLRAGAEIIKTGKRGGGNGKLFYQGMYRDNANQANLDLITAVEKAGGWPAFVLAHRRVVVGLVTKCAPLPTDAAAHVASFLWPEGGF